MKKYRQAIGDGYMVLVCRWLICCSWLLGALILLIFLQKFVLYICVHFQLQHQCLVQKKLTDSLGVIVFLLVFDHMHRPFYTEAGGRLGHTLLAFGFWLDTPSPPLSLRWHMTLIWMIKDYYLLLLFPVDEHFALRKILMGSLTVWC